MVGGICEAMETFHGKGQVGWYCRTGWMDGKKQLCLILMGIVVGRLGKRVYPNDDCIILFLTMDSSSMMVWCAFAFAYFTLILGLVDERMVGDMDT